MSPAGASRVSRVSGSRIGRMPVSRIAVTVQIVLEPDIGGYSVDSMMTYPSAAFGLREGRTRLALWTAAPRGS